MIRVTSPAFIRGGRGLPGVRGPFLPPGHQKDFHQMKLSLRSVTGKVMDESEMRMNMKMMHQRKERGRGGHSAM
ncbi:hypothetical protein GDO81_002954 [Engystomops pustulosus]|uniref:Uncharacterized protein n=1 Tax=Engystomops pustulosus TaxID=76066 RepID=A0AAV7DQM7_ENGPU|nr:hypothetical protein GDO81_002954 [Engystomops pustulosus]